jgi:hypothetical protein
VRLLKAVMVEQLLSLLTLCIIATLEHLVLNRGLNILASQ